jgi:SAM-dependent methyltransferase
MSITLPVERDYPPEAFRLDQPPELRVGCARAYFKKNAIVRGLFLKRVTTVFELLPPRKWGRALDAGTGAGFLLPALSDLAESVVGVDLSRVLGYTRAMLKNRGAKNVGLGRADLVRLPFPTGCFDLIVCISVIEHIPDLRAAFAEMRRVLGADGSLVIGYPMEHLLFRIFEWFSSAPNRLRRKLGIGATSGAWFHPHVSHYTQIEGSWDGAFRVAEARTIRLLGLPLYRMFRLVP